MPMKLNAAALDQAISGIKVYLANAGEARQAERDWAVKREKKRRGNQRTTSIISSQTRMFPWGITLPSLMIIIDLLIMPEMKSAGPLKAQSLLLKKVNNGAVF